MQIWGGEEPECVQQTVYLCVCLADPGEHVRCRRASCLDVAALRHTFGDETFGDEDLMSYIFAMVAW